jgi:maltooligosyltrehalose trehalohydrolase
VVCSQNHDQIGNRARGDRVTEVLDDDQLACAALLTLCGPFTPMLFMGEEWAASTPFQFFTSHPEPELGTATAEGRIAEFERMGWDPAVVPDPQDPETFTRSKLDWEEAAQGRHARLLDLYRRLGRLRRERPELTDPDFGSVRCTADETNRLFTMRRGRLLVALNLGAEAVDLAADGDLLVETGGGASVADGTLRLPPHVGAVVDLGPGISPGS